MIVGRATAAKNISSLRVAPKMRVMTIWLTSWMKVEKIKIAVTKIPFLIIS
jgi:hypothetical protein